MKEIKRRLRWFWQRRKRGFDDRDTWNLDYIFAEFMLPRLEAFKGLNNWYPANTTEVEWDEVLDDMIHAMRFHAGKFDFDEPDVRNYERVKRGRKYMGEYFADLWW